MYLDLMLVMKNTSSDGLDKRMFIISSQLLQSKEMRHVVCYITALESHHENICLTMIFGSCTSVLFTLADGFKGGKLPAVPRVARD